MEIEASLRRRRRKKRGSLRAFLDGKEREEEEESISELGIEKKGLSSVNPQNVPLS